MLIYWIKARGSYIILRDARYWLIFEPLHPYFLCFLVIHFCFVILKLLKLIWGLAKWSFILASTVKIVFLSFVLSCCFHLWAGFGWAFVFDWISNNLIWILCIRIEIKPSISSRRFSLYFFLAFSIRLRPIMLCYIYNQVVSINHSNILLLFLNFFFLLWDWIEFLRLGLYRWILLLTRPSGSVG